MNPYAQRHSNRNHNLPCKMTPFSGCHHRSISRLPRGHPSQSIRLSGLCSSLSHVWLLVQLGIPIRYVITNLFVLSLTIGPYFTCTVRRLPALTETHEGDGSVTRRHLAMRRNVSAETEVDSWVPPAGRAANGWRVRDVS